MHVQPNMVMCTLFLIPALLDGVLPTIPTGLFNNLPPSNFISYAPTCVRVFACASVCVCVHHCVNSELGAFYGLSARLRHFSNGSVLSHWQRYVTWIIIYKDMGKGPVMNTLGFGKSTLTSNCVAVVAWIQRNSISFLLHDIISV